MKAKLIVMLVIVMAAMPTLTAQNSDKKAEREAKRAALRAETTALLESGSFQFVAQRAMPTGYPSVDLISNPNSLRLSNDTIECYMPFFGRAYRVIPSSEGGFKFKEKAESLTQKKTKRGVEYTIRVRDSYDRYEMRLDVSEEGSANLVINSNNRASISYFGEIKKLEEK